MGVVASGTRLSVVHEARDGFNGRQDRLQEKTATSGSSLNVDCLGIGCIKR